MIPEFPVADDRGSSISKYNAEGCCGFAVLRLPSCAWSLCWARPPSWGLALKVQIESAVLKLICIIAFVWIKQTFPLIAD